jgi:hypothetical protein
VPFLFHLALVQKPETRQGFDVIRLQDNKSESDNAARADILPSAIIVRYSTNLMNLSVIQSQPSCHFLYVK